MTFKRSNDYATATSSDPNDERGVWKSHFGMNFADADADGIVDAADYTIWRDNLGSGTSLPNDDTAGVAADDYTRWKNNFGESNGSGAGASANTAVPEPATLVMLILAAAGWCVRRRRIT